MTETMKEQRESAEAAVKEVPGILGKELSEDDVRLEFSTLQRFGRVVHLTWSGSLVLAVAWVLVKVLRPDYTFTWADFAHDWSAIFLWWFGIAAALWAFLQVLNAVFLYHEHSVLWRYKMTAGFRIGMVAGMVLLYLNF